MRTAAIRVADLQDAAAVSDLLEASYPALMSGAYPDDLLGRVLPVMTRAQPALLGSGRAFVVEGEGRVVAFGGWSREEPGTGAIEAGLGHLRHFAVHPEAVRRGLARQIAAKCAGQALADGRRRWRVFSSLNAVPFYQSLGLAQVRIAEVTLGPVAMAVCLMEGPIARPDLTTTPG